MKQNSHPAWKKFETRVARIFGAQRRGAYTGSGRKGRPDLIYPGWSVECKLYRTPDWSTLVAACNQAERNRENPGDIPVAVVKAYGAHDANALVVMRLDQFRQHFVGSNGGSDEEGETESA